MRKILVAMAACALLLVTAGAAYAGGTQTYIDAPGAYDTACAGGVVGVVFGAENDITAECAYDGTEQVFCGLPGVVDWVPAPEDQITVTCEAPK